METDPYGKDAHEAGAKLDDGKLQIELVLGDFARALEAVAAVGTFGAIKYTEHGWLSVENALARYANAGGRHRLYRQQGEEYDQQTGLLHLAHEAWNKLAELELTIREQNHYGDPKPVLDRDRREFWVRPLRPGTRLP